jgi:hypothetical protein
MRAGGVLTLTALLLAGIARSTAGPAFAQAPGAAPRPGEGVLCGWAFVVAAQTVGKRCFAGQDAALQAELDASVAALDRYVLANSRMTPADVARFKAEQGLGAAPDKQICQGDPAALYQALRSRGAAAIRSQTEALTARAGEPTWAACT